MRKCYDCKFCDMDYIFDEEEGDEYEIQTCDKGHDTDSNEECADYKKYNVKEYKEEFSRCDTCENLKECIADGKLIEVTTGNDKSRHFMKGIVFGCKKDL